jgi:hypothetical protein
MNQVHLGWIATFVGDPLYRLPLPAARDEVSPQFVPVEGIQVRIVKDEKDSKQVWLTVDLGSTPQAPKAAQLRATTAEGGEVLCQTFESRPYVKLGGIKEACGRDWQIVLVDPFGNQTTATVAVDCDSGRKVQQADRGMS